MRRVTSCLAGAAAGGVVAAMLWLPLLALLALLAGGGALWGERWWRQMGHGNGAVLLGVLPALGLIQGGVTAAVRGRLSGSVLVEAMLSPFAWVMTAGEGMLGGVVMVVSLMPGACLGVLAGLWLAGVPTDQIRWPMEAGVGAVVGAAASLVGLNLYVQWPTLRARPEEPTPAPPPSSQEGEGTPATQ